MRLSKRASSVSSLADNVKDSLGFLIELKTMSVFQEKDKIASNDLRTSCTSGSQTLVKVEKCLGSGMTATLLPELLCLRGLPLGF